MRAINRRFGALLAGILTSASYFDGDSEEEHEIHQPRHALYRRVDWRWA
jgi:hypothetical protein